VKHASTLKEDHTTRRFEKRALRKIFGRKMEEVTKDRMKMDNETLYLYSS
jgi:hypothetical protein